MGIMMLRVCGDRIHSDTFDVDEGMASEIAAGRSDRVAALGWRHVDDALALGSDEGGSIPEVLRRDKEQRKLTASSLPSALLVGGCRAR